MEPNVGTPGAIPAERPVPARPAAERPVAGGAGQSATAWPPGMGPSGGAPASTPAERPAAPKPVPSSLLPPSAGGGAAGMASRPAETQKRPSRIDALLPPGAAGAMSGSAKPAAAMREVPLPTMTDKGTSEPGLTLKEPSKKIIRVGGEEIELRVLSPEEKARRRLKKNIIMVTAAAIIIGLALAIMLNM